MKPWTLEIEDSYTNFVQCGEAVQSFDKLSLEKEESDDLSDNWIEVEDEAFLSSELMSFNTAGTTTYAAPHMYQGRMIPRLLAEGALPLDWCDSPLPNDVLEHTQVKGISIQYLHGCTMTDLQQRVPRSAWQDVIDEAVRITQVLGDMNILNSDVHPRKFIVVPKLNGKHQVYMIDFALCRFRGASESDQEWGYGNGNKTKKEQSLLDEHLAATYGI